MHADITPAAHHHGGWLFDDAAEAGDGSHKYYNVHKNIKLLS